MSFWVLDILLAKAADDSIAAVESHGFLIIVDPSQHQKDWTWNSYELIWKSYPSYKTGFESFYMSIQRKYIHKIQESLALSIIHWCRQVGGRSEVCFSQAKGEEEGRWEVEWERVKGWGWYEMKMKRNWADCEKLTSLG